MSVVSRGFSPDVSCGKAMGMLSRRFIAQTNARTAGMAIALAIALTLGAVEPSTAQVQDEAGFQSFLASLRQRAESSGRSPAAIEAVFSGLTLNPRVIELDRAQPGANPNAPPPLFDPYRRTHVDAQRISRGRAVFTEQHGVLARVEKDTGVPGPILIAIWGHETNYGTVTGSFDTPRALASLAYEGRRRELFSGELLAAVDMVARGVPRDQLRGSWAGAMGNPQFLPSVYLRVARDGDGDGRADIWSNGADTLASIGNYFADAGWQAGEPWGLAVSVPDMLDRQMLVSRIVSPRCPRVFARHSQWRTMAEWRALGLAPQNRPWPGDHVLATLLEPDGPGKTAYLLTGNYRVILDYNCSNFYALSVGLLADAVGS